MATDILAGVHPTLCLLISKVLDAMAAAGHPMRVTQGLRTVEDQQRLYSQGRTSPGMIVTNADGIIHKSAHQARSDGWGHAVDCCFLGPDPFLDKDPNRDVRWNLYGSLVTAVGLKWGGNWAKFIDKPHAELDETPI